MITGQKCRFFRSKELLSAVDGGMDATGWDGERLRSSGNDRATPAGGPLRSFLRSGRAADRQMVTGPGNVACFQ